ncbi:MAG: phosphoribosylanthranilate isomerase [Oscillospiraceae bacterium]|nr:phosphoribosylanthranilate isomerase [Oscillospiraceae bacterium]
MKTKIKICGLFRDEDIAIVNIYKPDYIGFVFAKSRRRVTPERALQLRKNLDSNIIPVGVFVDEPIENIVALIKNGVTDMIQLHGGEDEDYIRELKSKTKKPVIKANGVCETADYLLFDGVIPGSGRTFDWNEIPKVNKPFFLAGGLNPSNVADAIKLVNPYAVDVSSGVETNGVKDIHKIEDFIKNCS